MRPAKAASAPTHAIEIGTDVIAVRAGHDVLPAAVFATCARVAVLVLDSVLPEVVNQLPFSDFACTRYCHGTYRGMSNVLPKADTFARTRIARVCVPG